LAVDIDAFLQTAGVDSALFMVVVLDELQQQRGLAYSAPRMTI
jgi:hypothetical protein